MCIYMYVCMYVYIYYVQATCHAPHREAVYSEIKRVLKPGALFACYEWCLTDKHQKGYPKP